MTDAGTDRPGVCEHCGSALGGSPVADRFCCDGCAFVYQLLHREGLAQFYALRGDTIPAVGDTPLQQRDFGWLRHLQSHAENAALHGIGELTLNLQGISCIGCVWLIERIFERYDGAQDAMLDVPTGRMLLRWRVGSCDLTAFAHELQHFGYLVGPPGGKSTSECRQISVRLGICAALGMNTMLFTLPFYLGMEQDAEFARLFQTLAAIFATMSAVIGGSYFVERAWTGLRQGFIHMDFPIALGLSVAWVGSMIGWRLEEKSLLYFDFVAIFSLLMLGGRWIQEHAIDRNRNRLLRLNPHPEHVRFMGSHRQPNERAAQDIQDKRSNDDGSIAVKDIVAGDHYAIGKGQVNPVQACIVGSAGSFSLEWITGESDPVELSNGNVLPAGARSIGLDSVHLVASETWDDSLFARLLQADRPVHRNPVLERILRWYLIIVLTTAIGGGAAWMLLARDVIPAFQVFLSVLVVSCPCALGIAFPVVTDITVRTLRRYGVFVREGTIWARISKIRRIVFDKTGTLTMETPHIDNADAALAILDEPMRNALYHLVDDNLHPAARAIRVLLIQRYGMPEVDKQIELHESVGNGVHCMLNDSLYALGRPRWALEASSSSASLSCIQQQQSIPGCDVAFAHDGRIVTCFQISESVREDARKEIIALAKMYPITILSGDRSSKVDMLREHLGLPHGSAIAELTPEAKEQWVLANGGDSVFFIGDGANDALAFAAAGVRATPVVDKGLLEQRADVYFLGKSLRGVRHLLEAARHRTRSLRILFSISVGYNFCAILVCLLGYMNPLLAAVLMPLSSILTLGIAIGTQHRT